MKEDNQKAVQKLLEIATKFIGVTEKGDNSGPEVEMFQKAVSGVAEKEPWCCGFAFYCILNVDKCFGISTQLFKTEHVMTLWNKSPDVAKLKEPEVGSLVVWNFYKNGQATSNGHVGIVTGVLPNDRIETIEGNTGDSSGVEREGDGVYKKNRSKVGSSEMKVVGFLKSWSDDIKIAQVNPFDIQAIIDDMNSFITGQKKQSTNS